MNQNQSYYSIKCSIHDLRKDIRETSDTVRKTILKRFLDIKIHEMRAQQEDPSLDGISDNDYVGNSDSNITDTDTDMNAKKNSKTITGTDTEMDTETRAETGAAD